jgi:general secretion pathway protein H
MALSSTALDSPGMPATTRRQAGMTLLEVIVGMAILGLVLTLMGTRGPVRSERLDLDGATRDLAGALQLARSRAIVQNRPVAVSLEAAGYSLDAEPPRRLSATIAAADRHSIVFAPNGSSSGGAIMLRAGSRGATLEVAWLTGRVTLAAGP